MPGNRKNDKRGSVGYTEECNTFSCAQFCSIETFSFVSMVVISASVCYSLNSTLFREDLSQAGGK